MAIMWDNIFNKNDNVVSRKILDETILVPIRGKLADMQHIITLNPMAEYIWEHLDGKHKVSKILDKITDEFDVQRDEAGEDMEGFLNALLKEDLIVDVV